MNLDQMTPREIAEKLADCLVLFKYHLDSLEHKGAVIGYVADYVVIKKSDQSPPDVGVQVYELGHFNVVTKSPVGKDDWVALVSPEEIVAYSESTPVAPTEQLFDPADYPKKCRACTSPAYESFMGVWSCTNEDCSNFCTRLKEKITKNPSLSKKLAQNRVDKNTGPLNALQQQIKGLQAILNMPSYNIAPQPSQGYSISLNPGHGGIGAAPVDPNAGSKP